MSDLFAKGSCTYCQEEINGLRIQCCVCSDFDMCLQCFATGAEIGPHKNDHAYRFVDHCAVGIFGGKSNWMGREELQLLEAMELYSFGNWDSVSEYVETRTVEEVRDEYISRYLEGNIGKATWMEVSEHRPEIVDNTVEDHGPLSPFTIAKLPPLDITPEEAQQLGYLSHRDDYEREYDMSAEFLVITLQLNAIQDSNIDIGLKLAQVDMYIRRLRERARRKRVVRDYQLAAKFFSNRKDTKYSLTKEQKDFRDSLSVFSQFLTSGEHERLIESIDREKELRFRLSELIKYRTLGLTTQNELIHYEQHVAYQHLEQIRHNKAGSSGYAASNQGTEIKDRRSEGASTFPGERYTDLHEDGCESSYNNNCNSNWSTNSSESITLPQFNSIYHEHILTPNELQLCSTLNLRPLQYVTIKTLIIENHIEKYVNTNKIDLPELHNKNDVIEQTNVVNLVAKYLSNNGWLPDLFINLPATK